MKDRVFATLRDYIGNYSSSGVVITFTHNHESSLILVNFICLVHVYVGLCDGGASL